jgi:hypothetical protein
MAGYSGTPLAKKLGLAENLKFAVLHSPVDCTQLVGEVRGATQLDTLRPDTDFIHFFTKSKAELARRFPKLKNALAQDGMLWISWPKKSSKVATDLTEDVIREIGLGNGLVDVKVCAVDEVWSGLKFVIRVKDRKPRIPL